MMDLDGIAAQMDDTSPYYLPALIAEAKATRARLAAAESVIAEIAKRECEMTNDPAGCGDLYPDDPCGPCQARRWKEAQG